MAGTRLTGGTQSPAPPPPHPETAGAPPQHYKEGGGQALKGLTWAPTNRSHPAAGVVAFLLFLFPSKTRNSPALWSVLKFLRRQAGNLDAQDPEPWASIRGHLGNPAPPHPASFHLITPANQATSRDALDVAFQPSSFVDGEEGAAGEHGVHCLPRAQNAVLLLGPQELGPAGLGAGADRCASLEVSIPRKEEASRAKHEPEADPKVQAPPPRLPTAGKEKLSEDGAEKEAIVLAWSPHAPLGSVPPPTVQSPLSHWPSLTKRN
ncbi:uncharacterized protein [Dasypus novemcinctus]|uniref:uncharacterized protein n=1 Tax=Dasypus novemcinctus TaxID=9361 RepID=UPI00265E47ED|nr:uncharacterized protein LOC101425471 [Dasypus novemcinctus]